MKDVGLGQVVELVTLADEVSCRETPVGEMLEEHLIGHQPRYRNDLPAGVLHQHLAQAAEVRDLLSPDWQGAHALHELVAGTARK